MKDFVFISPDYSEIKFGLVQGYDRADAVDRFTSAVFAMDNSYASQIENPNCQYKDWLVFQKNKSGDLEYLGKVEEK